jgi:uncharacterized protein (DUF362 family)
MVNRIGRREFIKTGAGLGVAAALGGRAIERLSAIPLFGAEDVVSVIGVGTGMDYGKAAAAAVGLLGGMGRIVPKQSRVAVLANVQSRHPGTFTGREVLRTALRLCREAGAAAVDCLSLQPMKQWEDTGLAAIIKEEGATLKLFDPKNESLFKAVPLPDGRSLTEARILDEFFAYDVFLNMPITKDHAGNKFTGSMKNLMGLNFSVSNRTFHKPDWTTDPNAIAHLDQCIVDLNKAVQPTLNIVDATEFISTNGPFGPGEIKKPRKVVVGADRVAVDAYCARLLGLKPEDVVQIVRGAEQGLGEMDLAKVIVKETEA